MSVLTNPGYRLDIRVGSITQSIYFSMHTPVKEIKEIMGTLCEWSTIDGCKLYQCERWVLIETEDNQL